MMTSKPANTDSDSNAGNFSAGEASYSVEELLSEEEEVTLAPEQSLEEKEAEDKLTTRIELPEPDAENITVLTHKLPNKPILPWNRYDSPWEESDSEQKATEQTEEKPEELSSVISSDLEEEKLITHADNIEIDEVE
ncbi:hypothetical protein [Gloeothece verrucosa]|uniref:Uncharacterized protein n=1 Tax=Gloeothece verrucosa (strain PCC 7822) TaxID=497965 RepID=E0UBL5_GLOV7|nr:hypothetical protein [Gloeothece verrucosa]ADN13959.1 hypothetical protein Cyan7822_1977 [Gloeothece verrucosa PCC 7822]